MELPQAVRKKLLQEFKQLAEIVGFQELAGGKPLPPEASANSRIRSLENKLRNAEFRSASLHWEFCEPGEATMEFQGEVSAYDVPPNIYLVGTVTLADGSAKFFKKFVSHPFYQLGFLVIR